MPKVRPILAIATVVLAVGACSSAGSPASAPASAGPSPASSPEAGGLTHPTGANEVVLRMEEGGGFVPIEFSATNLPTFTLYGDGTVVFRDTSSNPTMPDGVGPTMYPPLRTAKLTEEQVQALLEFAIAEGGLAVARERYDNQMIADAATTTFLINAGGVQKTVAAYALGSDDQPGPDSNVKAALVRLADRLRSFDQGGALPSDEFAPDSFRASLWEAGPGMGESRPWPWQDLQPEDFVTADGPDAFGLPSHELTHDQLAALGLGTPSGPVSGLLYSGPDGKTYGLALRPLLPDELD